MKLLYHAIKMFFGKKLTRVGTKENPLFVLNEVCSLLGFSNITQVRNRLPEKYFSTYQIQDKTKKVFVITITGLCILLLSHKRDSEFRTWFYETYIPTCKIKDEFLSENIIKEEYKKLQSMMKSDRDKKIGKYNNTKLRQILTCFNVNDTEDSKNDNIQKLITLFDDTIEDV